MARLSRDAPVSVALCTYNSGKYLREQLLSILEQTHPVAEIIVSDDSSRDGTHEVIRQVAETHPLGHLVKVISVDRAGGVVPNFERAIAATAGAAVALCDHDDVWLPHKIETMLGHGVGHTLVFSDAHIIDAQGNAVGRTLFESYGVSDGELALVASGLAREVLSRRNIVTGATVLVEGSFARSALPVGEGWVHDEWLAYLAASVGSVAVVKEPLISYRVHGANQIGVPRRASLGKFLHELRAGSARYKMHRDRTLGLMRTLNRMEAQEDAIEVEYRRLDFDNARLAYPTLPWRRLGPIRRRSALGDYARFTADSRYEMWRDLLQRP